MTEASPSTATAFLRDHPELETLELVVVDPNGVVRGKWAPVEALEKAFAPGVNFPLSLHGLDVWGNEVEETGLHISSGDRDGFFRAVPSSLGAVPWGKSEHDQSGEDKANRAQLILETVSEDGKPFGGCARTVLRSVLEHLAERGLNPVCAFELEFHLLKNREDGSDEPFEIAEHLDLGDAQKMYGLDALADKLPYFADLRRAAQWARLPIDTIVKEAGPGQYEVNLTHCDDALQAADHVVLLKRIVCECARRHGMVATFMAKPFIGQPGNGMHVHVSMLDRQGQNIFAAAAGAGEASLAQCVAGLLDTMPDMALLFINSHNGFRRMAPGSYAPTRANWGQNNRSVSVRIPAATGKARRLEHRVSGADANPYMVMSAILAGMMLGLDNKRAPALPALEGNAYEASTPNRGEALPSSLSTALEAFEQSAFAKQAVGETMHHIICALKRAEIAGFQNDISPLERATYL